MTKNIFLITLGILFTSCDATESEPTTITDARLYEMIKTSSKAAFYKNSPDTIPGNSGSAHTGRILVWYNAKAKEQLDSLGKVRSSANFAHSSLIVKEIFTSENTPSIYAILYKDNSSPVAAANGWIWCELNADGSAIFSVSTKGSGCVGCHATGIDYTRMNDAHP